MRYSNKNISFANDSVLSLALHPDYEHQIVTTSAGTSQVVVSHSESGRELIRLNCTPVTRKMMEGYEEQGFSVRSLDFLNPGKSANKKALGSTWTGTPTDDEPEGVAFRVLVPRQHEKVAMDIPVVEEKETSLYRFTDKANKGVIAFYIARFAISPSRLEDSWLADNAPIGALCQATEVEKAQRRLDSLLRDEQALLESLEALRAKVAKQTEAVAEAQVAEARIMEAHAEKAAQAKKAEKAS